MGVEFLPSVIAVIDRSGVPVLALPSEDRLVLVGSMIPTIMSLSRTIAGEEIEYIRTDEGVIFIRPIMDRGSILMFFRCVEDPRMVRWVVRLFISEVGEGLESIVMGFVMESDVRRMEIAYRHFVDKIKRICDGLDTIGRNYGILREFMGEYIDIVVRKCSEGFIRVGDTGVSIDEDAISSGGITADVLLDAVNRCVRELGSILERIKK